MVTWFQKVMEALQEVQVAAQVYDIGRYNRAVDALKDLSSDLELEWRS